MAVRHHEDKEAHAYATEDDRDQYSVRFSDPTGVLVKPKWRGTEQDKSDMDVLGRGQVLRVRRQTPMSNILFISINGGTADLFWGYIVVLTGAGLTYASLAEMASMAPTAGGQYHWVSEFAPPKHQKFLSYLVGWVCMLGWQAGLLSVGFVVGTVIQGLIVLNNPTYTFERWHGTLLVWAMTLFCVTFNTVGAKVLPIIQIVVCTMHFLGFFAVIVPLWVFSSRATPSEALLTFTNDGGWPTTGLSAMIGLLTPMGSLLGFDCVVHICWSHFIFCVLTMLILYPAEEVEDAGRTLPKSIMCSVYLNGAMGFIMAITLCFCLGDLAAIVDTPTGYPFIQVFYNATQSFVATNIMVSPTMHVPVRATGVSVAITCLASMINIGSTTALNAIVAL
ncbi:MAG: hypothetical protein Q9210_003868, partial [Variospora velana]